MTDWRRIEAALIEVLRSRGIAVAGDVGFSCHFVAMRRPENLSVEARQSLPTVCPLRGQAGVECGFDLDRVDVSELAKQLEDALR